MRSGFQIGLELEAQKDGLLDPAESKTRLKGEEIRCLYTAGQMYQRVNLFWT